MIIVGDWAPGIKYVDLKLEQGIILANLEGPVLSLNHKFLPAPKAGPSMFSIYPPPADRQFVFSLANNHTMDYGVSGLESTMSLLKTTTFQVVGAGKDVVEARRPIIVNDGDLRIGIIACCEAQFGIARRMRAGVAEFGPWVYRAISNLKRTVDAVVISVHAAVEDSPWPYPYIRELYRSFIDEGATVVHGHHSHVPQGFEEYGTGVIFYGMGNFAIDPDKWRDYTNGLWSLGAEVDFRSKPMHWRPITFEIRHQNDTDTIIIEESSDVEQKLRRAYLVKCNSPLSNTFLLDSLWQEVAVRAYFHYGAKYMRFVTSTRHGRFARLKNSFRSILGVLINESDKNRPSQYDFMLWYNMINCESHRQMLATALGVLAGEIKNLRTTETRRLADEMMPWSITNS